MNRQIIAKLASITAAVALLAGATFAAFTSNSVTITDVSLTSADPSLQVWDPTDGWVTEANNVGLSAENMYPGWEGSEQTFYLKNITGGGVPFGNIFPAIVSGASGDWNALKDVVQMRFGETGTGWSTNWRTLNDWYTDPTVNMLLSNLPDATQRQFSIQFKMSSSADDSAKGKNLTFTLSFVGQTP